jgi:hypothetical protein
MFNRSARPCDGVALTPMKGSELIKKAAEEAAAAPAAPKNRYVPPSARKDQPKPTGLRQDELSSAELFPTLGGAGSGLPLKEIVSRFANNQFAALDTEQPSTPKQLDFKAKIHERIERDEQEQRDSELPETENPLEMPPEQLLREGYAVLPLKGAAPAVASRLKNEEPYAHDPEMRFIMNSETWERMELGTHLLDETDSHKVFQVLCRPEAVGEDIWERHRVRQADEPHATNTKNIASPKLRAMMERWRENKQRWKDGMAPHTAEAFSAWQRAQTA